jgi:hypothetical protein
MSRTFRHFSMMEGKRPRSKRPIGWHEVRLFLAICWRQGIVRSTRLLFWYQLLLIGLQKPHLFYDYFTALGVGEHFFSFRHEVKAKLEEQLAARKAKQTDATNTEKVYALK